eukprot:scaffold1913_cov257-Pinguiococcus_pyrenoidosus.AAC.2
MEGGPGFDLVFPLTDAWSFLCPDPKVCIQWTRAINDALRCDLLLNGSRPRRSRRLIPLLSTGLSGSWMRRRRRRRPVAFRARAALLPSSRPTLFNAKRRRRTRARLALPQTPAYRTRWRGAKSIRRETRGPRPRACKSCRE